MLKIGYLVQTNSIHMVRWINYVKKKGIDVFAITNKINPELDVKQYELKYGLPLFISKNDSAFRNAVSPRSIFQVKNILRKECPDVLHAQYVTSYGFIGALTGFKPFIVTAGGSDVTINTKQYYGVLKFMVKFALKKANVITCDAYHGRDKIMELGGENIKIIYYGTDIKKFKPEKKGNELTTIISLRNHKPLYNIETLIRAIPLIREKCWKTYFIIAGSGTQTEYLKQLAVSLGVRGVIEFPGKVDSKHYLNQSHIYVSTSTSDGGLSSSTAEAMACRLPVVVTDNSDNRRWVINGVNGYLFDNGDVLGLAKHIIFLIKDKELCKRMGKVNREIIKKSLNFDTEMDKMILLYEELVNGSNKKV